MINLPHISQRNGTICCIRVIVVRLGKDQSVHDLKPPAEMDILTYDAVHNGSNSGAYLAEMLDANSRNIMIGDGVMSDRQLCEKCWPQNQNDYPLIYPYRPLEQYPVFGTFSNKQHRKRHTSLNGQQHSLSPQDGPLDTSSIYTAYLDAIGMWYIYICVK
jgi:hypothetical protein